MNNDDAGRQHLTPEWCSNQLRRAIPRLLRPIGEKRGKYKTWMERQLLRLADEIAQTGQSSLTGELRVLFQREIADGVTDGKKRADVLGSIRSMLSPFHRRITRVCIPDESCGSDHIIELFVSSEPTEAKEHMFTIGVNFREEYYDSGSEVRRLIQVRFDRALSTLPMFDSERALCDALGETLGSRAYGWAKRNARDDVRAKRVHSESEYESVLRVYLLSFVRRAVEVVLQSMAGADAALFLWRATGSEVAWERGLITTLSSGDVLGSRGRGVTFDDAVIELVAVPEDCHELRSALAALPGVSLFDKLLLLRSVVLSNPRPSVDLFRPQTLLKDAWDSILAEAGIEPGSEVLTMTTWLTADDVPQEARVRRRRRFLDVELDDLEKQLSEAIRYGDPLVGPT